jgi:hypothetical protein
MIWKHLAAWIKHAAKFIGSLIVIDRPFACILYTLREIKYCFNNSLPVNDECVICSIAHDRELCTDWVTKIIAGRHGLIPSCLAGLKS